MKTVVSKSLVDQLVEEYQEYLVNVAGLKASSSLCWIFFVRLFLQAHFKPKVTALDFQRLSARALLDYVLAQSQRHSPGRLQSLASALRSFCRFLCVTGRLPEDWSAALPPIAGHHREDLPRYLTSAELQKLLGSMETGTRIGKRDYAIVLCLARLGLRAGEVARLTLEDVDWRTGVLRLAQPKGRRERLVPLPAEVGQALVGYLCPHKRHYAELRIMAHLAVTYVPFTEQRRRKVKAAKAFSAAWPSRTRISTHVFRSPDHLYLAGQAECANRRGSAGEHHQLRPANRSRLPRSRGLHLVVLITRLAFGWAL